MYVNYLVILTIGAITICLCIQYGESTLMLTSLLAAAQTGMLVGKMSSGGLLMMLLAAQNQTPYNSGRARTIRAGAGVRGTSSRRYKRESKLNVTEEKIIRDRLVRQIDSAFDSLTCLPKFVCGINAAPPSKKTSLMNDYGHLFKVIFGAEGGDTDGADDETGDADADDDLENSDEEERALPKGKKTSEEHRLALKERENLNDMVHEELLDEDPGMISFVLKDVMNDMNNKKNPNRKSPSEIINSYKPEKIPESYYGDTNTEENYSSSESFSPLKTIASVFQFPTLKIKSTGTSDSVFDKDPFFEGFKRSMRRIRFMKNSGEAKATGSDDQTEYPSRTERAAYLKQKRDELKRVKDPAQKYQIAEDIGKKNKNQQDCATAFKKCPYEWDQVMTMVDTMRQNVIARPQILSATQQLVAAQQQLFTTQQQAVTNADKVVFLKTSDGKVSSGIPLSPGNSDEGLTTVTHDLGNGNTVEISMKLFKIQKKNNTINSTTTNNFDEEYDYDNIDPPLKPIPSTKKPFPGSLKPIQQQSTPSPPPTRPTLKPIPILSPHATILNVEEFPDDELTHSSEIESAVKIFEAINYGKLKPAKNKYSVPTIIGQNSGSSNAPSRIKKVTTTTPPPIININNKNKDKDENIKVSDKDQSITVTLVTDKNNKSKGKDKDKEKSTEEDDDDDELEDFLLNFRTNKFPNSKTRLPPVQNRQQPLYNNRQPVHNNNKRQSLHNHQPVVQNRQPALPPSLTRRRYPGGTPYYNYNRPRYPVYKSLDSSAIV